MNLAVIIGISLILLIIVILFIILQRIKKRAKVTNEIHNAIIRILIIMEHFIKSKAIRCPETPEHPLHDLLSRYLDAESDKNSIIESFLKYFGNKIPTGANTTINIFRIFLKELLDEQLGFKTDLNGFWLGPGNSSSIDKERTVAKNFVWLYKASDSMQKGYPYYFYANIPLLKYTKSLKKSFRSKVEETVKDFNLKKDFGTKGLKGPEVLILFFDDPLESKNVDFSLYFDGYFLHGVCFKEYSNEFLVMESNNPLNEISLKKYKEKNSLLSFAIFKKMEVEIVK